MLLREGVVLNAARGAVGARRAAAGLMQDHVDWSDIVDGGGGEAVVEGKAHETTFWCFDTENWPTWPRARLAAD